MRRAYRTFKTFKSGTTESMDAIFIPCSPPPARQRPAMAGTGGNGKEILSAVFSVSAHHAQMLPKTYARALLRSLNELEREDEK